MLYDLVLLLMKIYLRLRFCRFRVEGIENVPLKGRFIFVCNHSSNFDPPIVGLALLHRRRVHYLAKKELFEVPVLGWIIKNVGAISVDRGHGDLSALKTTLKVLAREDAMAMFPEGTRAKDGKLPPPKAGIGLIAAKSGAPVVYARLSGTEGGRIRFGSTVSLIIGGVKTFESFEGSEGKEKYQEFSAALMKEIYSITEENASEARAR